MTEVLVKSFIYRHLNDHIPSADDASARLSSFTEAAAPLGLKISWAKTKLQNRVRHRTASQSMAATLNLLKILSISEVCSLPMDAAAKISNAVSDWLLLL